MKKDCRRSIDRVKQVKLSAIFMSKNGQNMSEDVLGEHKHLDRVVDAVNKDLSLRNVATLFAHDFVQWAISKDNKLTVPQAHTIAGITLQHTTTGKSMFSIPLRYIAEIVNEDKSTLKADRIYTRNQMAAKGFNVPLDLS